MGVFGEAYGRQVQILICRAERTPPALRATSPFRGGIWANLPGVSGAERPDLNRTRRRVRRGRGFFHGREPVDQSEKSYFADLPPGNRLRFQANLRGMY